MTFKKKRTRRADSGAAGNFQHASGYTDLAGVLGEHTLHEEDAEMTAPKGYRARSIAKTEPSRRS